MPYKSEAQRKYMHANAKQVGAAMVKEFDKASKGLRLPVKVKTGSPGRPKTQYYKEF